MTHEFRTIAEKPTNSGNGIQLTRECSCGGWWTIAEEPEPAHHTPLTQREADHLTESAKIEDGSIWNEIPANHSYRLSLQSRPSDGSPNHVVIWAAWLGGFQKVLIWPWTEEGLGLAQQWCDEHHTVWTWSGHKIRPGQLAVHARDSRLSPRHPRVVPSHPAGRTQSGAPEVTAS